MIRVVGGTPTTILDDAPVAPPNLGPRSFTGTTYGSVAAQAVLNLPNMGKAFAGPRRHPLASDEGSVFDFFGLRPLNALHAAPLPASTEVNANAGQNGLAIALEIPKTELTQGANTITPFELTTSRLHNGSPVQTSRAGMARVRDLVIPVSERGLWQRTTPGDYFSTFAGRYTSPLARPLLELTYPTLFTPANRPAPPRVDLADALLTGLAGVNQGPTFRDWVRLNTGISATPAASQGRLGLLPGINPLDINQSGFDAAGWPNGRRPGDDITDIMLQVLAGAVDDGGSNSTIPGSAPPRPYSDVRDGINTSANDYDTTFPYLKSPVAGYDQP